jgi:hypothetical protein
MVQELIAGAVGAVVSPIIMLAVKSAGPVLETWLSEFWKDTPRYVRQIMRNDQMTRVVMAAIIQAQKEAASEPGHIRFEIAKNKIKAAIPDIWDDAVGHLLQSVYDTFTKTEIDNI